MKISTILTNFANKSNVKRYCEWANKPKVDKYLNNGFPLVESAYVTSLYCIDIKASKDIPEERKNPLVYNSLICMVAGMFGGITLNKLIKPIENDVVKNLEKMDIKKVTHVIAGIRIILPLLLTSLCLRFIVPIAATPTSVFVDEHFKSKKKEFDKIA